MRIRYVWISLLGSLEKCRLLAVVWAPVGVKSEEPSLGTGFTLIEKNDWWFSRSEYKGESWILMGIRYKCCENRLVIYEPFMRKPEDRNTAAARAWLLPSSYTWSITILVQITLPLMYTVIGTPYFVVDHVCICAAIIDMDHMVVWLVKDLKWLPTFLSVWHLWNHPLTRELKVSLLRPY